MREISGDATLADALTSGVSATSAVSASPAPAGTLGSPTVNLTIDFTYSAVPVQVTAPPASSTAPSGVFS